MRYPFVLFDVGETLIGPRESYGAVYARVLGGLGVEVEAPRLDRSIAECSAEMALAVPPGVDRFGFFPGGETEFWSRFCASALRRATAREAGAGLVERALSGLRDAFGSAAAWQIYPDVEPTLEALRVRGCRLGIVSNWDSRLPRLLDTLGLARSFDAVGVSHLEGVEKPHPELFSRVLRRLGARAEQTLHVGNVADLDLEGARRAGIDALLLARGTAPPVGLPTIADLREVVRHVEIGLDAAGPTDRVSRTDGGR